MMDKNEVNNKNSHQENNAKNNAVDTNNCEKNNPNSYHKDFKNVDLKNIDSLKNKNYAAQKQSVRTGSTTIQIDSHNKSKSFDKIIMIVCAIILFGVLGHKGAQALTEMKATTTTTETTENDKTTDGDQKI